MIIYNKNSKTNPIISMPKPMGYSLSTYHLRIVDVSTGKEYDINGLSDIGYNGDFVTLEVDSLNMLPVGDYVANLNDGYSTTGLRIVADGSPTYYTPEITRTEKEVIYNG